MAILKKLRKSRGFTLVELMIVVVIIGILASLAIYGVQKYVSNSKSAEARLGVGAISKGAVAAFEGEGMEGTILTPGQSVGSTRGLCAQGGVSSTGTPATVPQGVKVQTSVADWQEAATDGNRGWNCVKFSMTGPQYYRYQYLSAGGASTGVTYQAVANGDLTGDGARFSTFSLSGEVHSSGTLLVAPAVTEVDPSE